MVLRCLIWLLIGVCGVFVASAADAQIYWIEAPEFAPPWTGYIPELGDLDGDGDYDLIHARVLHSYRNIGAPSVPSWQQDDSLVAGVDYVQSMTTCLADLDADGDLDLSVGHMYGEVWSVLYYRNVGSVVEPIWQNDNSMFQALPLYTYTHPELADLDADGDLDLVVSSSAHFTAYRNTGTPATPTWTEDASLVAGIVPAYGRSDHNFGDLDGDGDLDIVLGSTYGDSPVMCFENTGTPQTPAWTENEGLLTGVPRFISNWGLDLADLDADGDLDLLDIHGDGPTVYLNCGPITLVEQLSTWGKIKAVFR